MFESIQKELCLLQPDGKANLTIDPNLTSDLTNQKFRSTTSHTSKRIIHLRINSQHALRSKKILGGSHIGYILKQLL